MKKLIDVVKDAKRRLIAPIISYPGVKFTNTTALENLKNPITHLDTLIEIVGEYGIDIVMTFMDLSIEAEALGIPVEFKENESPDVRFHPLENEEQLNNYIIPNPRIDARMPNFLAVVKLMKQYFPNKVCGGMVTAPFTLAGLMMGAEKIALNTVIEPDFVKKTLEFTTEVIRRYVKEMERAGADFIILLEPTAVLLSPDGFREFVHPPITKLLKHLNIPAVLHICGNTTSLIPAMCETGVQGLSLDGVVDFRKAAEIVPEDIVLIGNIDPVSVMINMGPEGVYSETIKFLDNMKDVQNLILSTGCDLPTETPHENIHAFCRAGRDWNRKMKYGK
ncbi:MAG: uroporphyrinogen decarboxylase family protein [Acetivibrionales bacterium]|jgi:uroporphyrinogen decarboxylase